MNVSHNLLESLETEEYFMACRIVYGIMCTEKEKLKRYKQALKRTKTFSPFEMQIIRLDYPDLKKQVKLLKKTRQKMLKRRMLTDEEYQCLIDALRASEKMASEAMEDYKADTERKNDNLNDITENLYKTCKIILKKL